MISTALLVAALVLFILASIGIPVGRYGLGWAGLACWVLSLLVGRL
jgi:hypothetical protein